MANDALVMSNITKTFPGVLALQDVSINLIHGEVLALVGENGAGKSTLMKILGGVYKADQGIISIDGSKVDISDPLNAQKLGISIIFQEVNLIPTLSVAENMFLGKEVTRGKALFKYLNRVEMGRKSESALARLESESFDTSLLVQDLPVAKQQLIEIARALMNESRILVMDEPTSALTETEAQALFGIIETLKKNGISIIYISHRLEEVEQICDRITVLRDGKYIITFDNSKRNVKKDEIVKYMVGREIRDFYPAGNAEILPDAVLRVKNLSKKNLFSGISLAVHKGEIVGLSGLIGAGRTEVAKTIFGEYKKDEGEIWVSGKQTKGDIADSIKNGLMLIPEDRKKEGLVLCLSLGDNISLPNAESVSSAGVVAKKRKNRLVQRFIDDLKIRPALPNRPIVDFSGGNQQKAVIAKWLAKKPRILILDEPTRGVDVGAKSEIYGLMRKLTEQGVGILFISSEMPELIGMCDRILAMHEGRLAGEFHKETMDQRAIMAAATGIKEELHVL
ncbi:MAG: sugar ABC transporter ATP-binding protein [Spirochaetales bacterium]|jgi:ribose transport system ATP-binding protein|nr:sugar ABC transporter ATP-binding protein [Spirochaetales bacterium]